MRLYLAANGRIPGYGTTAFRAANVTVSEQFAGYTVNNGATQDVVGNQKEIWPQVLEKAVASLDGGYGAIANGGYPVSAMEELTGHSATSMMAYNLTLSALQSFVAAGDLITMDTPARSEPAGQSGGRAFLHVREADHVGRQGDGATRQSLGLQPAHRHPLHPAHRRHRAGRYRPSRLSHAPGAVDTPRAPRECRRMSSTTEYVPPQVWTWKQGSGGRFANINRPIAGPTHDKELPVGRHPLQLYSLGTPNGVKVTIMLEELLALGHAGAEYDAWLIRIGEGEQFGSGFVAVNPNSKIPALVDRSGAEPIRVFESGAILTYLAEKFGAFLPTGGAARAECLSWLFWQMGSAPYLGGGFGHFYAYAPTKIEYAIDRFAMEAKRQLDVLDRRLAESEYIAGADYTIADIAIFPWYGGLAKGWLYGNSAEFLSAHEYKNLRRWADMIAERPTVRRGRMVNRLQGDPASQLHERHEASDFETKTQDKLAPAQPAS